MKSLILIAAVLVFVIGVTVCSSVASSDDVIIQNENSSAETIESNLTSKPKKTLKAFRSQKELNDFLREIAERQQSRRSEKAKTEGSPPASNSAVTTDALTADSKDDESVTNVQHAGVDEGGIVKLHGDYLIILRRCGAGDCLPFQSMTILCARFRRLTHSRRTSILTERGMTKCSFRETRLPSSVTATSAAERKSDFLK
jgi:hypothetical protein